MEIIKLLKGKKLVTLDNSKGDIRELLPNIIRKDKLERQPRNNLYRNLKPEEKGKKIVSGFPLKDERHSKRNQRRCTGRVAGAGSAGKIGVGRPSAGLTGLIELSAFR